MQAIIDQILEGQYEYEGGSLDFSCIKVELLMHEGEVCEGSFHIYSAGDTFTHGYVTTTDMRMECLTGEFTGNDEEICYRFHGEHLQEGDVVKGNFCVVSNHGEYYLPFVATVEYVTPISSMGDIKNVFHFANLAKTNWREAVDLFYSPEFIKIFEGADSTYLNSYKGLSAYPGNEQNVEEFLIHLNKKHHTDYVVREEYIYLQKESGAFDVAETSLTIMRNGWGYTSLNVECDGEFLFTRKDYLDGSDFQDNKCVLPVFVDEKLCRDGRNFGRVLIYNSYVSFEIPVCVQMGEDSAQKRAELSRKKSIVKLMHFYQDFRLKRIGAGEWLSKTSAIVDEMMAEREEDVETSLFKAQLLISEERYNEANWLLEHSLDAIEDMDGEHSTLYAYYLYLTTLIEREAGYVNEVTGRVEKLFARDRENWRIAWLLLYLSEDYNKTATTKWEFLEKQFAAGCASPVLYIEAIHLLNGNPTLLRKLNHYVLAILNYGSRQQILSADLIEQVLYLSGKSREYNPVLIKILQRTYKRQADDRILQEICAMLIRGSRVGTECFEWYELGVKAQLRITNLYEYYMMSADGQNSLTIPRIVLMYFSYQSNLDLDHTAFLYRYVSERRNQLGDLYETYKPRIEHFVVDQLQKGRINRNLAELYQMYLTPAMITEQTAEQLARILFANRIQVSDYRMRKVIVYQTGNLVAREYTLSEGRAWVPIYGNDATILFEDAYGNRFINSVEYTTEKLMIPGKYLRMISGYVTNCVELDIYRSEYGQDADMLSDEAQSCFRRICRNDSADEKMRSRLYLKLLRYYYDTDNLQALNECLDDVPVELLSVADRGVVLRYLVRRGRIEEAWDWVRELGPGFVESKPLMRLVSEEIEIMDGARDETLLQSALYCFRQGKYDSRIVQYIAGWMEGSTKELRDVWKALRFYDLDAQALSKKVLIQMLFSGAYVGEKMEIFAYYVSGDGDRRITQAFLDRCCYDYFVKERLTDSIVFHELEKLHATGETLSKVCKLAYLKYYSEHMEELTEEKTPMVGEFLEEFLAERIHLNMFKAFVGLELERESLIRELMDKTIVEYRAKPGNKVFIHYVIMREDGAEAEYLTVPCREVCGGVCFKEFVLFFGETLQYYITEQDEEEQLTESGNLQRSDIRADSADWRYEMINDIIISKTLEDYDTLDGLLDEYYKRDYFNENLFALMK